VYKIFFFQTNTIGVILKNVLLALPSLIMGVNGWMSLFIKVNVFMIIVLKIGVKQIKVKRRFKKLT